MAKIREIFVASNSTYGHRRIKKQLKKAGNKVQHECIRHLMRENGLISVHKVKYKATTNSKHNYPAAPSLLQKDFRAYVPCQKWVGDITYIPTEEGWLYLAAVKDLYHRKVVGWALGSRLSN